MQIWKSSAGASGMATGVFAFVIAGVWIDVSRTAHHPDVIVLVRNHHRNALNDPLVRQRLGPKGINFVYRYGHILRRLRLCIRSRR
jgi:hypothetical protein